jgi:hypothetical protein
MGPDTPYRLGASAGVTVITDAATAGAAGSPADASGD